MRAKYLAATFLLVFVAVALVMVARDATRATAALPEASAPRAVAAMNGQIAAEAARQSAPQSAPAPAEAKGVTSADVPLAATRKAATTKPDSAGTLPPAPTPAANAHVHRIVATYFHGDIRCATCRKVEAYAKEAVESGFADAIARGEVVFRAVNVDQPENRHFIEDFQLTAKSVVVTDEVDGTVTRHVKLEEVWRLVGDHDAYLLYVQDAVRAFLEQV